MSRLINQEGLDLIKSFEGLRTSAYRDSVGVPTIGYGHTKGVKMGQTISETQAEQFLREDLADAEAGVEKWVKVPLSDNEFAALVSFTFNLGVGSLSKSTLLRKLNADKRNEAAVEFLKWNRAGGKVLEGLTRRRKAEHDLFLKK